MGCHNVLNYALAATKPTRVARKPDQCHQFGLWQPKSAATMPQRQSRLLRCNAPSRARSRETQEAAAQMEYTASAASCCNRGLPAGQAAGAAPAHAGRAER